MLLESYTTGGCGLSDHILSFYFASNYIFGKCIYYQTISCGLLNCGMLNYTKFIWEMIVIYVPFFIFAAIRSSLLISNSLQRMGCFTVLKSKKKKSDQIAYVKRASQKEHVPTVLPEPQTHTRSLQSAPPSFRTRVKPIQSINKVTNNRTRALSAPSTLDAAEQDALAAVEYEEQEEPKYRTGSMKEQHSSSPQPLPLPSPQGSGALKAYASFKLGTASGPLNASGPLPLPPTGSLRNFPYDEIAAACHHFTSDRYMSESLSSTIYKASFGDDPSSSKKFEATVTRLHPSSQVLISALHFFSFIPWYSHAY